MSGPFLAYAFAGHCGFRSEGTGAAPELAALGQKGAGKRVARVRVLSEEEKARISSLSSYKEMDASERKRQLSALDRRMRDTASLPPGLLAQYQSCFDSSERKFEMVCLGFFGKVVSVRSNFIVVDRLASPSC